LVEKLPGHGPGGDRCHGTHVDPRAVFLYLLAVRIDQGAPTALMLPNILQYPVGNVGVFDDHDVVTRTDRKKDMVLASGFNVYPNKVEAVIAGHPMVFECAVVGVPDPHSGEDVKAFVVSTNPALSEEEVIRHCRESLTNYKVPKLVEFLSELPKSNVGKIQRRKLRTT
jgi:acyl-CoA synthetase (AMP-forming)/AMP-acid ligase II